MPAILTVLAALLAALLLSSHCHAAGGHHAVDDASILDPGQCNVELWAERAQQQHRRLQHAGTACHVAGVELGLSLDRGTAADSPTLHPHAAQVKWATALTAQWSLGAVAALGWQNLAPKRQAILLVPVTWTPREDLALHLNVGRVLREGAPDRWQRGAAIEWQPVPEWQGLAEVFHDGQRPLARLGLRRFLGEKLSIDLSRARARATAQAPREDWWTLGVNWEFGGPF
ncbi:MAG: hypothetical protein J7598_11125 [Mitsuaria chitosanitabida]|uniref:hypothetical protein n=1 Tax=Roseateles chitosanitabidus TaxID=65048 RepID=UPI001B064422|nr:hypothetical protein [Roseateles chitosanitabidus]MBO9687157.1 hypothetical protein [Roseateles chitosanitabidus]